MKANVKVLLMRVWCLLSMFVCVNLQIWSADSDIVSSVTSSGTMFTITRKAASVPTIVNYRTTDGSAVGGIHFKNQAGRLYFKVGELQKTVTVETLTPTGIYQYGNADRKFGLEVWNAFSDCQRAEASITNPKSFVMSDTYREQSIWKGSKTFQNSYPWEISKEFDVFTNDELAYRTATGQVWYYYFKIGFNFTDAFNPPLGFGVGVSQKGNYLSTDGVSENGNLFVSTFTGTTSNSGVLLPNTGTISSGTFSQLSYKALTSYKETDYLFTKVDDSPLKLYVTFNANGAGNGVAKLVKSTVKMVDNQCPKVTKITCNTDYPYSLNDELTLALHFDEIVYMDSTTKSNTILNTNVGDLKYVGGDGTNVIYFRGTLTSTTDVSTLQVKSMTFLKDMSGNQNGLINIENTDFVYKYSHAENLTVVPDLWNKSIKLNWSSKLSDGASGKWNIYRYKINEGVPEGGYSLIAEGVTQTTYTDKDESLLYDRDYVYFVDFVPSDWTSNQVYLDRTTMTTAQLQRNYTLNATLEPSDTYLKISWNYTPFGDKGTYYFQIYRKDSEDGDPIQLQPNGITVTDNTKSNYVYYDKEVTSGCATYYYYVETSSLFIDDSTSAGVRYMSNEVNGMLTSSSQVTSVSASKGLYEGVVKVTWEAIQTGTDATDYIVYRRELGSDEWVKIYTISGTQTNYTYDDNTAIIGKYYEYKVSSSYYCTVSQSMTTPVEKSDEGFIRSLGVVSGRVTYGTGTAVEGVRVLATKSVSDDDDAVQFYALRSNGIGSGLKLSLSDKKGKKYFENTPWSIQLYVNPDDSIKDTNNRLGKAMLVDCYRNFGLYLVQSDKNSYTVGINGAAGSDTIKSVSTNLTIPAHQYSHLTFSYDGDTTYTVRSINSKGEIVAASATFDKAHFVEDQSGSASNDLYFGGAYNNVDVFYGYIDEVRVFSGKQLTNDEILKNYNHTLSGNESKLVVYLPMDEGIKGQTKAFDYSKTSGVTNDNHALVMTGSTFTSNDVPTESQLALYGITDEYGNYTISGIPFRGDGTTYMITPTYGVHEFSPKYATRFISASSTVHSGVDFEDVSSFEVHGIVTYYNTNYPVEGASVYVDGVISSKDGNMITSDKNGEFVVSIPIGDHHISIQKQDHVFVKEGRYPSNPLEEHTFDRELSAPLQFYDSTFVTITGRVAGGLSEKEKLHGFGLGKATIGKATIVMSAGDNYQLNLNENDNRAFSCPSDSVKSSASTGKYNDGNKSREIIIHTDTTTGEFAVSVPPIDFKIESVKVDNNNDIVFSTGEMETILLGSGNLQDETDSLAVGEGDTLTFTYKYALDLIYRSNPVLEMTSLNADEGTFGDKYYVYNERASLVKDSIALYTVDTITGDVSYTFGYPLFTQGNRYNHEIYLYEPYINYDGDSSVVTEMPLVGAEVTVSNNMGATMVAITDGVDESGTERKAGDVMKSSSSSLIVDSLGKVSYDFKATYPNIVAPYTLGMNINYVYDGKSYEWSKNGKFAGIVVGGLQTGSNFITAGPDKVLYVLRDPAGSNSYAYLKKGQTFTTSSKVTTEYNSEYEAGVTWHGGAEVVSAAGFGYIQVTDFTTKADVYGGTIITYNSIHDKENEYKITTTDVVKTSDSEDYVGADGDVFIGSATNIITGKSRNVAPVKKDGKYSIEMIDGVCLGEELTTQFKYTQSYIENTLIPNLKSTRNSYLITVPASEYNTNYKNNSGRTVYITKKNSSDADFGAPNSYLCIPADTAKYVDTVGYFNTQVALWETELALNEEAKVKAIESSLNFNSSEYDAAVKKLEEAKLLENTSFLLFDPYVQHYVKLDSAFWFNKKGGVVKYADYGSNKAMINNILDGYTITRSDYEKYLKANDEEKNLTLFYDTLKYGWKVDNLSFDAGTSVEQSIENCGSSTSTYTCNTSGVVYAGTKSGFSFCGLGFEFYAQTKQGGTEEFVETENTTNCTEINYVLSDKNSDDAFSVDVYKAPDGFGPIFYTRAGQTSCPYEGGRETKYYQPNKHSLAQATMQIENPRVTVGENNLKFESVIDIPSGSAANFTLNLDNLSESSEAIWYTLRVLDETNANGAALSIDGVPFSTSRQILVNAFETTHKNLQIKQSRADIMKYDSIAVVISSSCQEDIADTVYLSVEFVPSCSPLTLEIENKVINSSTLDTLQLSVKDYEKDYLNFNEILVQYKGERDNDWNLAEKLNVSDLESATKTITFPMSSSLFTDQTYQFRAVSVCQSGSNTSVTRESEIIDVIKDMVRPQVLGNPNPADGILDAGDEISVTYNEDIRNAMLSKGDNFTVQAVLNDAEVDHNVALKLDSTTSFAATTDAAILLANKNFAVDMWVNLSSGGTLLNQSSDKESFTVSVESTGELVVNVNGDKVTSSNTIPFGKWCFLTISYTVGGDSASINALVAYDANQKSLFKDQPMSVYGGIGKLSVGKEIVGAVSELALWNTNRSVNEAQSQMYFAKTPSTENLIGYWKFDEGHGTMAIDAARSRNMNLLAETWYLNNTNYAASLDGNGYLALDITRNTALASDDYMVEMWFRGTSQKNATLWSANTKVALKFNNAGYLTLLTDNVENQLSTNDYLDGAWHHVALNVLRNGTTTVYVDGAVVSQLSSSKVPALQAAELTIGALHYSKDSVFAYKDNFRGDVDEIRYWLATFNGKAIDQFRYTRLNGNEAGLQAYYPFEETTVDAGQSSLQFSLAEMSDTLGLVATAVSTKEASSAPALKVKLEMTNVNFSYVASERTIVISLNEKASRLEGTTVNFSVRNVLDANNNYSLPVTWSALVNCNRLQWTDDQVVLEKNVDDVATFTATISNQGASTEAWSIKGLPLWLTADKTSGSLSSQKTETIKFEVSEAVDAGKYEESILLSGNEGINVPLSVNLTVSRNKPEWSVNPSDFENSMSILGQLKFDGEYSMDPEDRIAAFINNVCVGVASPVYYSRYDAYFLSLDVYGDAVDDVKIVTFKAWDASTGVIYPSMTTSQSIRFAANKLYGTMSDPVLFESNNLQEQIIPVNKNWNWISINVEPTVKQNNINEVFPQPIKIDFLKDKTSFCVASNDSFVGSLNNVTVGSMYKINMKDSTSLSIVGTAVDLATSQIVISNGWNWIGFNPTVNMSLNEAFAGLDPNEGDLVKGQAGFAYYEGYQWVGTLTTLNPGKGYMYNSTSKEKKSFTYPTKSSSASLKSLISRTPTTSTTYQFVDTTTYPGNMTIVAVVKKGEDIIDDAEVGVFDLSGVCRGTSSVDKQSLVFLTVAGETANEKLQIKVIYNNEEYVLDQFLTYSEDAHLGTLTSPYVIQLDPSNSVDDLMSSGVSVYPTLVETALTIQSSSTVILNYQITDLLGRLMCENSVNDNYTVVNVSSLNSGVYTLILNTDQGQMIKRFSVK